MTEQEEFEFRLRLERESAQGEAAPAKKAQKPDPVQAGVDAAKKAVKPTLDKLAGGLRGAGSIGATLLAPLDMIRGKGKNTERRQAMTDALQTMGADTDSVAFQAGKLGGEIAGTAGVGPAIAGGAAAVPGVARVAPNLLTAIRTGGMSGGAASGAMNPIVRAAGGAITGGASAGLVDPEQAKAGATIGAVLPEATRLAGAAGRAIGRGARAAIGQASPEVAALAQRAKELGIDIPADRLVNSKPLDAVASGLNYMPFSGRAATEAKMVTQLNQAASRLMGQNTPNINQALRKASDVLGAKFDTTLKGTGVVFDQQLLDDVTRVFNTAQKELGSDALRAVSSQVDELVQKGSSGVIDGQAAYNIKRTLDRIGRGRGPEAYHALELKGVLMDALNRSLGPEQAAAFAMTRQQYGNMLALEKLAKNGVEGEISVARLANMQNINNEPLQELADIAAQFVKAREGQHGAAQRAFAGMGATAVAGPALTGAGMAAGRAANTALNSDAARSLVLGVPSSPNAIQRLLANQEAQLLGYRAAPVAGSGR